MLAMLWLLAAPAASAAPAAAAACASDCRAGGGFAEPLLYYTVYNTTEETCCALCRKNATCSFSIRDVKNGDCWLSPSTASGWHPNPIITTCRTSKAPPWPPMPPPPAPAPPAPAVALWPAPRGPTSAGTETATFTHDFAVHCTGSGCPTTAALGWYQQRIQASAATHAALSESDRLNQRQHSPPPPKGSVSAVTVHVSSGASASLLPTMNESYTLACSDSSCTITAAESVGALRGLETLAHLAHNYVPGSCRPQPGGGQGRCGSAGPLPMPLTLADSPRFPYRGLLIDSARECAIDAMRDNQQRSFFWNVSFLV